MHELRARALVWTDDLARSSGESVHLGVLHQQGVLIVHHVFRPDDSRQVLEIGAMQPLHSTALGKVLSAYDPVAHSEALEADDRTVCEPDGFEHVLDITRARGYAADVEETWEGIASIAAPSTTAGACRRRGGHHRAVERLCREGELRPELVAAVRDCARARSRATWAPGASETSGQGPGRRTASRPRRSTGAAARGRRPIGHDDQ